MMAVAATGAVESIPRGRRKDLELVREAVRRAVRNAALEDLERAPGVSKAMARAIHDHFHPAG